MPLENGRADERALIRIIWPVNFTTGLPKPISLAVLHFCWVRAQFAMPSRTSLLASSQHTTKDTVRRHAVQEGWARLARGADARVRASPGHSGDTDWRRELRTAKLGAGSWELGAGSWELCEHYKAPDVLRRRKKGHIPRSSFAGAIRLRPAGAAGSGEGGLAATTNWLRLRGAHCSGCGWSPWRRAR
jgi:hypothetical protein